MRGQAALGADVRVGISGWTYPPWRSVFYPKGLAHKRELAYAASRLSTIEINGSFYSLQRPSSWRSWAEQVPADFAFSVKGGRFITHMRRLRDVEVPLGNFFASGPVQLGPLLGPFLWQLPAMVAFDAEVVDAFFRLLPRTHAAAAALARRNDGRLARRTGEDPWVRAARGWADVPLRHALEVRHESFRAPEFADLCRRHDVALVVSDGAGRWPLLQEVTADHVYVRLHGDVELYASGYSPEALDLWADRVRRWAGSSGVEAVHVYLDNDAKVHAPYDAIALAERLGVGVAGEAG